MELVELMSTTTRGHQVLSLFFICIVRDTQETFEPLEHQQTIRTNDLRRSITTVLQNPYGDMTSGLPLSGSCNLPVKQPMQGQLRRKPDHSVDIAF